MCKPGGKRGIYPIFTPSDCCMRIPVIETRLFVLQPGYLRGGINGGFRTETSMRLLAEQPAASLG